MIERLAIFGATGDLTARYLLPGLAALQAAGQLGDRFQLASAGREAWDTGDFRQWAAAQLDRHCGQFPAAARQAVVSGSSYHQADVRRMRRTTPKRPSARSATLPRMRWRGC
jgi:glucose-6-phosphate 1-dehydrogenase